MNLIADFLNYDFLRYAALSGVLAGVLCGIIGTLVVVYRMVFVAGGIAHTAYGGVGIALYFGFSPLWGSLGISIAAAFGMSYIIGRKKERCDAVIGAMWAVGMALGIVFADLTPGYQADFMSYLFGSILAVGPDDIIVMTVSLLITMALVIWYYEDIQITAYDEEYARTRGVRTNMIHTMLMVMAAVSVVLTIRVVGLILVIALLTIPSYIAENRCKNLCSMMITASVLGVAFVLSGLVVSYVLNITSGAVIILIAGAAFTADYIWGEMRETHKKY